jgi:uncharacterized membrane protein
MPDILKLYATALIVFSVLDFVWLGLVMGGFYRAQLDSLVRTSATGAMAPVWPAALLVYALLVVGILEFVIPRVRDLPVVAAFGWGAAFGVIVYGVYDLTNYATISRWPIALTLTDIAWGGFICGSTTAATHAVATWLRG